MSAVRNALTVATILSAVAISACGGGSNSVCSAYCVQFNGGMENESQADLDAKIKKACEGVGRHGTPQIREKTKDSLTAYCPE